MANHEELAKFAKYFLIIVNIILVIIGLLAIALGLYVFFALDNVPPIFLVTIFVGGVLTAVICLLGCIGARKENPKLLRIYAGIITGLLILNLVLTAINATQGKLLVGSSMQSNIKKIFDDYGKDPFMTGSVDQIQQKLFCCGFYEPISMKQPGGIYPRSCCRLQESECRDPFPIGCSSLISNRASSAPTIAYWVGFAISWILYIALVIMAFYLASIIKKKRDAQQSETLNKYGNL